MARPANNGLDYFPLDTDYFDSIEIMKVAEIHGLAGEIVAIKLTAWIYRHGYAVEWNEMTAKIFARRVMCDTSIPVGEIVEALLEVGYLDRGVFQRTGKLTSRGIQKRWAAAQKLSKRPSDIDPELNLLDGENTDSEDILEDSGNLPENSGKLPEDSGNPPENSHVKKRKEKKSILLTNQQTHACARTREDGAADPVRAEIVRILVKPNDFSIDRDLIDRTVAAVQDGVPGLGPKDLQRISKKADEEVARYDRTDGRSGKQYRWMTIADEIHARFKAAGREWDEDFAGENEPPPRPRSSPMPAAVPEEPEPTADELIASLRDKATDPAGETLEQTARRLKCTKEIAFSERATWRRLKQMQVLT